MEMAKKWPTSFVAFVHDESRIHRIIMLVTENKNDEPDSFVTSGTAFLTKDPQVNNTTQCVLPIPPYILTSTCR